MPETKAMTHTEDLRYRCGDALGAALHTAAGAAARGDWPQASGAAEKVQQWAAHTQAAVVRDALAAGLDWWQLGELLGLHPQAAWQQYRGAAEGLPSPAAQRPRLAVVCTAGLVAAHDIEPGYGIGLDDLGSDHSLARDPDVTRLRGAAAALGEDLWITVRLPGGYEGDDELPDAAAAVSRWTTVVLHPDELGWLREALALNAGWEDANEDGIGV
jgi:hypothetical protein